MFNLPLNTYLQFTIKYETDMLIITTEDKIASENE